MHVYHVKHVLILSDRYELENRKTIYLLRVTPRAFRGTILLRTKPLCYKRMRRLVSVRVFYILGGRYITYGITHKC